MIFRQRVKIDWEMLKQKRSQQAVANNTKENKKRVEHEYKVGDMAILLIPPYERSKQAKISTQRMECTRLLSSTSTTAQYA